MKIKDYYKVLDLTENANLDSIKNAFRTLAKKFHPDINNSSDAAQKFQDIFEAYEILRDENKRKNYDALRGKNNNPFEEEYTKFEEKVKNDKSNARQQAYDYSQMPYNDFISSTIFDIKFVAKNSPKITILSFMILVGIGIILLGFLMLSIDNTEGGVKLIMFLSFFALGSFLIYVGKSDLNKVNNQRKSEKSQK